MTSIPNSAGALTPMLRIWGAASSTLVSLLSIAPDLARRLMLLPACGLHATGIAFQVSAENEEALDDLAMRVRNGSPRDLLDGAILNCPPTLFRALERAEPPVWPLQSYRLLSEVLRSPAAEVIASSVRLTEDVVRDAHALLDAHPVVWKARRAFRTRYQQKNLTTVVALLEHLGLLQNGAALPEGAGRRSVARRVRADLGSARCPEDGFPVPHGWTRVETVAELWQHGRALQVCLAPGNWHASKHAIQHLTGEAVFLFHAGEQALAHIQRVAGTLWVLSQVGGRENSRVQPETYESLRVGLVAAGVRLLPADPADALTDVLRRDFRQAAEGEPVEDVDGDDLAETEDIAA